MFNTRTYSKSNVRLDATLAFVAAVDSLDELW